MKLKLIPSLLVLLACVFAGGVELLAPRAIAADPAASPPPAATRPAAAARKIEKPRMRDVLARKDAAQVLEADGRIKRAGPHVHAKPKFYVRRADNSIIELDADTTQPVEIPVGAPPQAPAVTWYTPALPADFGPTIDVSKNPLWSDPFEEKEIWQGQNGTCYELVVFQSGLREKPGWVRSKDVIQRRADGSVAIIYRRNLAAPVGVILDNRISALDSRLNPKTGACAIPLLERGYDFFRTFNDTSKTSTNTRASTSFGWMGSVMTDLGIKNLAIYPSQASSQTALMAALASDQLVTCCTKATPPSGLTIGAHAYSILNITVDAGQTLVWLRNPWGIDGAGDDGDTSDGVIKETWAQWSADMSAACVSTEYPKDVELAIVNTTPPPAPAPAPTTVPGDANGDGFADYADFVILSNHYSQATTRGAVDGDFDADGRVMFADYVILANHFNPRAGALPDVFPKLPRLDFVKPAPGADPAATVVTGPVGTAVELSFATDADDVVQTAPNSTPITLTKAPQTSYGGYISTIPAIARTFTYTATRAADGAKTVKTVTLAPATSPDPAPQPAKVLMTIDVFEDGNVKKRN